ncbi:MAG: hypothetical protein IH840_00230 [Candidatus Heimdallarchaeota archaeon]|nr:hypothetical protein [Candidatus Heimdallarchaeota archaeon]
MFSVATLITYLNRQNWSDDEVNKLYLTSIGATIAYTIVTGMTYLNTQWYGEEKLRTMEIPFFGFNSGIKWLAKLYVNNRDGFVALSGLIILLMGLFVIF